MNILEIPSRKTQYISLSQPAPGTIKSDAIKIPASQVGFVAATVAGISQPTLEVSNDGIFWVLFGTLNPQAPIIREVPFIYYRISLTTIVTGAGSVGTEISW